MLCGLTSQEPLLRICIFPTGPVVHRLGAELGFFRDMELLNLEGKELCSLSDQSEHYSSQVLPVPTESPSDPVCSVVPCPKCSISANLVFLLHVC